MGPTPNMNLKKIENYRFTITISYDSTTKQPVEIKIDPALDAVGSYQNFLLSMYYDYTLVAYFTCMFNNNPSCIYKFKKESGQNIVPNKFIFTLDKDVIVQHRLNDLPTKCKPIQGEYFFGGCECPDQYASPLDFQCIPWEVESSAILKTTATLFQNEAELFHFQIIGFSVTTKSYYGVVLLLAHYRNQVSS